LWPAGLHTSRFTFGYCLTEAADGSQNDRRIAGLICSYAHGPSLAKRTTRDTINGQIFWSFAGTVLARSANRWHRFRTI